MRGNIPVYRRTIVLGVLLICLTACGATAPAPTARAAVSSPTAAATRVVPTTTGAPGAPACPNTPVTLSVSLFHLPSVEFHEGLALVNVSDKYGFIDHCGTFVVEPRLTAAQPFSQGLAAVQTNGNWGYVDTHGTLVIPAQYDFAGRFAEGLAPVWVGGLVGYIDRTGAQVIAPQFAGVQDFEGEGIFSEGLAAMRGRDGAWGYIDHTGRFVIPPQFTSAQRFAEGRALVSTGYSYDYAFIDTTGARVISVPRGREVTDFAGGLAVVREAGRYGYMDRTGRLVTPLQFDYAYPIADGRGLVKVDQHWGYIDPSGAYALPPQYVTALSFSEGWAAVRMGNSPSIVCIDPQGAVTLSLSFDCAIFRDGIAITSRVGGQPFAIDRTGRVLFSYTTAYPKVVP